MHKLTRTVLTLQKRTDTLRTLLRQGASEYKLQAAAKKVLEARIRVLRAKIGELSPVLFTKRRDRQIAKLSNKVELLLAASPSELLAEFRRDLS